MGSPTAPESKKKADKTSAADNRQVQQRLGLLRADAQAYYERGLQAFAAQNYDDALADLDAAIAHAPGYAELYTARGWIGMEAGKVKGAAEDFAYALKLNKRDWLAQYGLGVLAYNRKAWSDAVDLFTAAQAIAPGQPEVWFHRGASYYELHDEAKALADMHMALRWFKVSDSRRADAIKWIKALGGKPPASEPRPKAAANKPSTASSGTSGTPTRAAEAKPSRRRVRYLIPVRQRMRFPAAKKRSYHVRPSHLPSRSRSQATNK